VELRPRRMLALTMSCAKSLPRKAVCEKVCQHLARKAYDPLRPVIDLEAGVWGQGVTLSQQMKNSEQKIKTHDSLAWTELPARKRCKTVPRQR
jgi:hypothetical protein